MLERFNNIDSKINEPIKKRKIQKPDLSLLKPSQKVAFDGLDHFVFKQNENRMILVIGGPGNGKTYTISMLIEDILYKHPEYVIAMTAPTNKAVKILKKTAIYKHPNLRYITCAKLLELKPKYDNKGKLSFVKENKKNKIDEGGGIAELDLLIIDEVSMLQDPLFEHFYKAIYPMQSDFFARDCKIIFLGDKDQIPPVSKKRRSLPSIPLRYEMRDVYNIPVFELTEPMRQTGGNSILKLINHVRERIHSNQNLLEGVESEVDEKGNGFILVDRSDQKKLKEVMTTWFTSPEYEQNEDLCKIICYTNDKVDDYNRFIRRLTYPKGTPDYQIGERLIANKPVKGFDDVIIIHGSDEMVIQEKKESRVYDIDNNGYKTWELKVKVIGGFVHRINIAHEDDLDRINYRESELDRTALEAQRKNKGSFAWKLKYEFLDMFADVSYIPALTGHKSQGSTYEYVVVNYLDILKNTHISERNKIFYVAISRAAKRLIILR